MGSCEHVDIGPGPRMPLLYGSAPTEVCIRCGMWRDARRPRSSYPYPKALRDWRPAKELLTDIARGDDRE